MKKDQNISSYQGQSSKAVANLPTQHPFSVPNGYFEDFPSTILSLVKDDPKIQKSISTEMPFSTPENYFQQFSTNMLEKIKSSENAHDELVEISPGLLSLKSENPFKVPENYFNNFESSISTQTHKFVPFFSIKHFIQYAAAACIIGIVFFVYRGMDNKNELVQQNLAVNAKTSELSTESLNKYLIESDIQIDVPENEELASNDVNLLVNINKETVSTVLSEISENDIKQFLSQSENSENNNIN